MGHGISMDLRERVVAAHERGDGSIRELALRFNISTSSLTRWLRLKRETGSVALRPYGGGRPRSVDDQALEDVVDGEPDATLDELIGAYAAWAGSDVTKSAVYRALVRLGWTRKRETVHADERDTERVRGLRAEGRLAGSHLGNRPRPLHLRRRVRRQHRDDPHPRPRSQGPAGSWKPAVQLGRQHHDDRRDRAAGRGRHDDRQRRDERRRLPGLPRPGPRARAAAGRHRGRKRHILVDTSGLPLAVHVHAANIQDRKGVELFLDAAARKLPSIGKLWADGGYTGSGVRWIRRQLGWDAEVVRRCDDRTHGAWRQLDLPLPVANPEFQLVRRRWVVERTFAWLGRNRRFSRDYEAKPTVAEAWIWLATSRLIARRLAHPQGLP